jgi:hypothetical protein
MAKKIVKAVEETVVEVKEDLTREANEVAGTITVKRWQVALAAALITALVLVVIL